MKTLLTLDVLKTMSSDELEDYRAAGEDFRRELSHAVMRDLTSPSSWSRMPNTGANLAASFLSRSVLPPLWSL